MAPYPSKPSFFYLHPNAITFGFNALGDPDNLAISIYSNAKVSAYIREIDENDSLGFTPADEYRQWTLAAFPTHFTDEEGCERYAHIAISRTTGNATLVFPPTLLDVFGRAITEDGKYFLDEDGKPMIPPEEPKDDDEDTPAPGEDIADPDIDSDPSMSRSEAPGAESSADPSAQAEDPETSETPETPDTPSDTPDYEEPSTDGDYFFFFIGKITSSQGGTKNRQWASTSFPVTGTLDTARYWEEEQKGDWAKMFSLNETMQWIEQHFPINISKIHNLVMRGLDKLKEITIKGIFAQGDKLEDVPVKDLDSYLPTLGAVRNMSEGQFLSKVHDDAAKGNITFEQSIYVLQRILLGKIPGGGGYMGSADFDTGLMGHGFRINEAGHAEFDSVSIRKFIEVPELRFNRITVRTGVEWHTFGAGLIEEVIHPAGFPANQGVIKLKLEDGEYGAIAANDYCMGIYHYEGEPTDEPVDFSFENYEPADNEEKVVDNRNGNFAFAGFATIYFKIIGVCDKHGDQSHPDSKNQYFVYQLRDSGWVLDIKKDGMEIFNKEMTAYHPQPNMSFACYANPNDPERQACEYRTTKYTVLLTGMTKWTYDGSNIAMVTGWLEGFSIPSTLSPDGYKRLEGSGIAFGNAYMWGTIDQFDRPAYIITQEIYTMITADLPSIVQEHVEAGDWQTAYDWSSGIKSATESQPYCYSYWKQTYDNGDETFIGPTLTGYHTSLVSLELSKEIVSVAVSDWYIDGEEGTDDIEFDVTARLKLGTNYATITSAVATSDIDGFSYDVELLPEESVPGSPVHSYARFHITIHGYVGQNIDGTSVENNFVNITLFDEFGNNATRPVTISENRKGEDGEKGDPGDKGDPGTSLTEVINYYAWGSSGENPPYQKDDERWSTGTIPSHPDSDTLCYLWNYEQCLDAEGVLISGSEPACIGYYPNDGLGIKDIKEYYRVHTSPTAAPTPIPSVSSDGKTLTIPEQWKLEPDPTDNTNKHLWNCEVVQMSDDTYRVNTPHVAGTHGEAGVDGPGQEFVFLRSILEPTLIQADVTDAAFQQPEYLPTSRLEINNRPVTVSWTDDPTGVDADHPLEWVAKRVYRNGRWEPFGKVSRWAVFAENGESVFITYCDKTGTEPPSAPPASGTGGTDNWHLTPDANCVWISIKQAKSINDGTWSAPIRMRGADGTSVNIKGNKATKDELEETVTNPSDGDGYIVDADGHLYVWSSDANQWVDCGLIQGEAGKSAYVHIKYANETEPNTSDTVLQLPVGDDEYVYLTFTQNNGEQVGDWMGVYTDNQAEDSNSIKDEKWQWRKTKGEQGDKGDKGDQGDKGDKGDKGDQGEPGIPGRNISQVDNYYAWLDHGTLVPNEVIPWGEANVIPSHPEGKDYLWNYESCSDKDIEGDIPINSEPACIGYYPKDGVGIESITEYYAVHDRNDAPPAGAPTLTSTGKSFTTSWSDTPIPTNDTYRYLWNSEVTKKTDGTYIIAPPHVAGVQGNRGNDGTSITPRGSYDNKAALLSAYRAGTMNPMPTDGDAYITSDDGHLHAYSSYLAVNPSKDPFVDLGPFRGEDGKSLAMVVNFYAWWDSGDSSPALSSNIWRENVVPSHPSGFDYLWNYELYKDVDENPIGSTNPTPVCIGYYPKDGKDGKGISSITEFYYASSSNQLSDIPAIGKSDWSTDPNSENAITSSDKKYLWNWEKIEYTDGTHTNTTPHIAGVYGDRGPKGDPGSQGDPGQPGKDGYNGCSIRTTYWREAPQYFTVDLTFNGTFPTQSAEGGIYNGDAECYLDQRLILGRIRFENFTIRNNNNGADFFTISEPFELEINTPGSRPKLPFTIPVRFTTQKDSQGKPKPVYYKCTCTVTFINCTFDHPESNITDYTPGKGQNNFVLRTYGSPDDTHDSKGWGWHSFMQACVPDFPSIPAPNDNGYNDDIPLYRDNPVINGTYSGNAMIFRNDADNPHPSLRVIDIALVEDKQSITGYQAYMCRKTHVANYATTRPGTSKGDAYWSTANVFDFLSVNMLLAKYAKIEMASGNQLLIMGENGKVLGGISGYGTESDTVRLWIGSEKPEEAPFRVLQDGTLFAANVNSTFQDVRGYDFRYDSNGFLSNSGLNLRDIRYGNTIYDKNGISKKPIPRVYNLLCTDTWIVLPTSSDFVGQRVLLYNSEARGDAVSNELNRTTVTQEDGSNFLGVGIHIRNEGNNLSSLQSFTSFSEIAFNCGVMEFIGVPSVNGNGCVWAIINSGITAKWYDGTYIV